MASAQLKTKDMSIDFLFDSTFGLLEVYERFVLITHWIDPSMHGVVIDEGLVQWKRCVLCVCMCERKERREKRTQDR
mgnify:CR=1 FL=1